ncbi:hypothetical protein LBMAG56_51550 [Verrucomicrobiota bacterium]|nr:hypothetical protein LBMAG56_51550 [Verrucomicrobiota bacterium]
MIEPLPGFDTVAEGRKWKESVAFQTAGMSIPERMAYFRRHSTVAAIRNRALPTGSAESGVPPEELPARVVHAA